MTMRGRIGRKRLGWHVPYYAIHVPYTFARLALKYVHSSIPTLLSCPSINVSSQLHSPPNRPTCAALAVAATTVYEDTSSTSQRLWVLLDGLEF